jgi:dGTPase
VDWIRLLNKHQLGENKSRKRKDERSEFQRDFDRIVFCSSFRRLQDKTQVFPLPETDFVHTRLTHSLEVSCVGRSLGNFVGERVIKRHKALQKDFTKFAFGEIVAAACLAHDIGNPPFGHSGEDAISDFFGRGPGSIFKAEINNSKKWNDLIHFEGNAEGFRTLTTLQNQGFKGGLRLTFATLAALTKYPKESFVADLQKKNSDKKSLRKFGFFQSEKKIFKAVAEEVGLQKKTNNSKDYWWCRHPLAFLVEAADDICYRIMDLEDGYRLGLLSFGETEELLMPLAGKSNLRFYNIRDYHDKIGYLRAKAISNLVGELSAAFLDEERNILSGKYDDSLISAINKSRYLEEIKLRSVEKIYRFHSVVEREAAGYEVLGGLLEIFVKAVNDFAAGKMSPKNITIINLIPRRFIFAPEDAQNDFYNRLLRILDFVSGMTDSFAVSLYRKLKGISLPGGRITY